MISKSFPVCDTFLERTGEENNIIKQKMLVMMASLRQVFFSRFSFWEKVAILSFYRLGYTLSISGI
jgi:hypothetical protein